MTPAYVGLGSNLSSPRRQIERAFEALAMLSHTRLLRRSNLYRSAPWGHTDQPDFVNAVARLDTALAPRALLEALLSIERAAGRTRDGARWGPRVLDLDLLVYGDDVIDEPGLHVPHAHLAQRAFVLAPLAEIAPELQVPRLGRADALLAQIDASACLPLEPEHC